MLACSSVHSAKESNQTTIFAILLFHTTTSTVPGKDGCWLTRNSRLLTLLCSLVDSRSDTLTISEAFGITPLRICMFTVHSSPLVASVLSVGCWLMVCAGWQWVVRSLSRMTSRCSLCFSRRVAGFRRARHWERGTGLDLKSRKPPPLQHPKTTHT